MSLDFGFTSEQELLRGVVRSFAAKELTPEFLRELDASGRAPHELLPKMAALGFTGLAVPPEYGGTGGSATDVTVLLEEMGRGSLSIASLLNRAMGWGTEALLRFGTAANPSASSRPSPTCLPISRSRPTPPACSSTATARPP
jgi:alkylation response protein AidB-like acyl-CoA dehydrogenase